MARAVRILIAACAVAVVGSAASASARQVHTLDERFVSVALAGHAHARVVLPPGYDTSGKRYPVVYFLHGLPAGPTAYLGNDWMIDAMERAGPAILVFAQGARGGDTDPEYLNWGAGRNWETYVTSELPRYVDVHFRTIRARAGRGLVGLSAGGYGATVLGLHHLDTFAGIESWSGYFHPTDPTGTKPLDRGPAANAHTLIATLKADERRRPTFLGFYVGSNDSRFRAENVQFDRELAAAGVAHVFRIYAGAHETSLWRRHAPAWLALLLRHLARPAASTST